MLKGYENKRLKLNTSLRGHDAGATVRVQVDKAGIPVDHYWRNRLKDSEHDGCCELVGNKSKKTRTTKGSD